MEGFKPIFDNASVAFDNYIKEHGEEELFSSFRLHPEIYGFIHNGDNPPDVEAVKIAMTISPDLYNLYVSRNKHKKVLGYGNLTVRFSSYDNLDSRHIMMNAILWNTVKEPINRVVEVGGGFGNWRRLNPDIKHWTIVDLPFVCKLQDWYLKEHGLTCEREVPKEIDLVIGTHSLSELSWDTFEKYFYDIVMRSKYFFYSYHLFSTGEELVQRKIALIEKYFDLVVYIPSEDGNCANCVYKIKPIDPKEMFSD